MSYILDALKKSEAERSRGIVPALLTSSQAQFRPSVGIWVLLGALIANACLFAAWIYWRAPTTVAVLQAEPATVQLPPTDASPTPTTVPPLDDSGPGSGIAATMAPQSAPVSTTTSTAATIATSVAEIQAPAQIAASVPPQISFSTHVYADDPAMRAVTLNGRRFVEGETISAGVVLKQITETGVVLDMNGQTVAMDVLQDWR